MFDTSLGLEVEPSAVESSLRKMLESDVSRSRACLMNLVVCSEERGSLGRTSRMLERISREHACRAIVVEFDRAVEVPSIRSWVTAHCHLGVNGKQALCSEQIAYLFTGWVEGRFQSTVFARALSDLPLVFWWQGGLTPMFTERLSSVIDRLIVDSAEFENLVDDFAMIECAVSESALGLVLQDLAWARSWQFRNSIASLFDDGLSLNRLGDVEFVEVVFMPKCRVTALQLVAWFGLQAGWELVCGGGEPRYRSGGGREVVVRLCEDDGLCGLGMFRVEGGGMCLEVSCEEAGKYLRRVRRVGGCEEISHGLADCMSTEALVEGILSRGGKNSLYRRVIPHFLALLKG